MDDRAHLIAVARGDAEPDLVITGARVFAAHTREWLRANVAIAGGRIAGVGPYEGSQQIDASGRHLVPGFIDAHVHLESSKLTPAEFARAVVARGTTAVVCDPHEIANVAGVEGVRWLLEATEGLPLDVFVMAPSCVPASGFESPCGPLGPEEMRRRGMWVLIREASNARNLRALLGMVERYGPEWCAFCTDDREPDLLWHEGHIDQMCRIAVGEGIAPEDVLAMATLHGARAHGLRERGAIAPGYVADLVLLDDLVDFRASLVLKAGAEPVFA